MSRCAIFAIIDLADGQKHHFLLGRLQARFATKKTVAVQVGAEHSRSVGHVGIHVGNEADLLQRLIENFFLGTLGGGVVNGLQRLNDRGSGHGYVLLKMSVAVFGIEGTTALRCVVSVGLDPLTKTTQSLIGYTERRCRRAASSVLQYPWASSVHRSEIRGMRRHLCATLLIWLIAQPFAGRAS